MDCYFTTHGSSNMDCKITWIVILQPMVVATGALILRPNAASLLLPTPNTPLISFAVNP